MRREERQSGRRRRRLRDFRLRRVPLHRHRVALPELLRQLLSRREIVYGDMYWAKWPLAMDKSRSLDVRRFVEYFSLLHRILENADLSPIAHKRYGYEPFDEELCRPIHFRRSDRILVSPLFFYCSYKNFQIYF